MSKHTAKTGNLFDWLVVDVGDSISTEEASGFQGTSSTVQSQAKTPRLKCFTNSPLSLVCSANQDKETGRCDGQRLGLMGRFSTPDYVVGRRHVHNAHWRWEVKSALLLHHSTSD